MAIDSRYDPRMLDALIDTGDIWWIVWAACELPDSRYDPRLLDAVIKTGDVGWVKWAEHWLPDERKAKLETL
jgi:hypothetical protein